MSGIQNVIAQTQKRGGFESVALISSLGLPVASVGVEMGIGVLARSIFSVFDRVCSELDLGEAEHIAINGENRSFIVKPLRKEEGKLHSWFVAVAPTFGGSGAFQMDPEVKTTKVTPTGIMDSEEWDGPATEVQLLGSVAALWSGVAMLEAGISLGAILGVQVDGEDGRVVVVPDGDNWNVALLKKTRRLGKIEVELDRASLTLRDLL
ncbi:MAG: hypothetical protein ACW99U_06490 [Candidatus Thorarchaeota archaeon]|jgi:predicted regulator of Ras-like GTPase activity (Roadblock/LC7/MglB family)